MRRCASGFDECYGRPVPLRSAPEVLVSRLIVVVPCYNEAARLDIEAFTAWLVRRQDIALVLVNDGSSDQTGEVLVRIQERFPERVLLLNFPKNCGKAEAVRRGIEKALESEPAFVGYLDADLATPFTEMERLLETIDSSNTQMVLAARVALLGRDIQRNPLRHSLGRVFASVTSVILRLRVYDTQCGAKILRPSPALRAALDRPFVSRWAFDVELIGRMLNPTPGVAALLPSEIVEVPLNQWHDIPGSKLSPIHMARTAIDLVKIAIELRQARAACARG
jgi:dolichyl-phosphate beta-glucosyltransferase